jgi:hypothetical protein
MSTYFARAARVFGGSAAAIQVVDKRGIVNN